MDGVKLVEKIKEENPYHYRILCSVPLPHHFIDDFMSYSSSHPAIVLDPETGGLVRINLNTPKLSPFDEKAMIALKKLNPEATMLDLYAAVNTFTKWTSEEDLHYKFVLRPGQFSLPTTSECCTGGLHTWANGFFEAVTPTLRTGGQC